MEFMVLKGLLDEIALYSLRSEDLIVDVEGRPLDKLARWIFLNLFN
jgi:hypothetical protein